MTENFFLLICGDVMCYPSKSFWGYATVPADCSQDDDSLAGLIQGLRIH